jgi:hypothetical protein
MNDSAITICHNPSCAASRNARKRLRSVMRRDGAGSHLVDHHLPEARA